MVIFVEDVDDLPWCVCLTPRKPPVGWTLNRVSTSAPSAGSRLGRTTRG